MNATDTFDRIITKVNLDILSSLDLVSYTYMTSLHTSYLYLTETTFLAPVPLRKGSILAKLRLESCGPNLADPESVSCIFGIAMV